MYYWSIRKSYITHLHYLLLAKVPIYRRPPHFSLFRATVRSSDFKSNYIILVYVNPHVPSRGPQLTTGWEARHDIICYVHHCLRQILDTRPTRRFEHLALYFSLSWSLYWQIFVVIFWIRWHIFPAVVSNVKNTNSMQAGVTLTL